jgi:hypothetical protein
MFSISAIAAAVAHQHRHAVQARQARGAEAALAGDDLVHRPDWRGRVEGRRRRGGPLRLLLAVQPRLFVAQATNKYRLHDALRLDRLGELVQRALVHARARLVHARHHVAEQQRRGLARIGAGALAALRGGLVDLGSEQRFEAAAQALGFHLRHL